MLRNCTFLCFKPGLLPKMRNPVFFENRPTVSDMMSTNNHD